MRKVTLTGIILIMIGIIALSYQVLAYAIRERIVDPGLIGMTADMTGTLSQQPIVGAIALVSVIVLLIRGNSNG